MSMIESNSIFDAVEFFCVQKLKFLKKNILNPSKISDLYQKGIRLILIKLLH